MWASRPNINGELMKYWVYLSKTNILIKEKQCMASVNSSERDDLDEVTEIITGSGSRQKMKTSEAIMREGKYGENVK